MLGYATSMRTVPTTQPDTAIVNANLGMVAMGAAEMTTTTEFNEADMVLALEAAGYTTYGPAEEKACKLAQIVLAASRKKLMEQEPVGVTDMTGGIYWKRGAPIQAKLYAAPMPQANESEAVKALRELHDAWADNSNDLPRMAAIKRIADRRLAAMKAARAVLVGEPGATGEPETMEEIHRQERERPYAPAIPVNPHDPIQPKQAQAMDERNEFERKFPMPPHCVRCGDGYSATEYHAWLAHSYKDKWEGWQARAALAQAQASGKAEKYCDDHCTWLDHDPECVIGGKAAPSDEEIDHIARKLPHLPWGIGSRRTDALNFARALLERYGNA